MQRTAIPDRLVHIPGYQLLRRVDQSAAASTYLATCEGGPARLLLKVFTRPSVRQANFEANFQTAAQSLSRLRHPNIPRIYEGGIHRGICYLALEYVAAEAIDQWAMEAPLRQLLQQLAEVARGLRAAHGAGFVHGGIEAGRVVVNGDNRALLTGLEDQLVPSRPAVDDPHYLAPECYQGQAATAASDIYSLGMLLFSLLAQRPPEAADFAAAEKLKSVAEGVPSLPGHLRVMQPLINRCLAPEPGQRFEHVGMLAEAIEAVTDEDLEAIEIATPHYLARLMKASAPVEPSPQASVAPAIRRQAVREAGENTARAVPSAPRRRTWPLLLMACIPLVAGTAFFYRDRLPFTANLLTWTENQLETGRDYLSRFLADFATTAEMDEVAVPVIVEPIADEPAVMATEDEGSDEPPSEDMVEAGPAPGAMEAIEPEPLRSAAQPQLADDFIAEGDRLLAQDALTVPDNANALAAYRQALLLDPGNARAWAGLQNIVRRYIELAQAAVENGERVRAAEFVRRGLSVDPNNQKLLSLQSQLTAQESPPDASEVEALSAMARIQMVRENYVTPAGDSAYDYYSRLLLLDPSNPEARSGLARVERELASEIELQVNRNRFSQAQALLVQAQDAFPASQRLHRLTLALETAMQSEQDRFGDRRD